MRAVRDSAEGIRVVEVPDPEVPDPVVRVRAASICGSDFDYLARGTRVTLGHELAGEAPDGTPVAVEALWGCGTCEPCRTGRGNLCREALSRALGLTVDGGMSDWLAVPAAHLLPLPAELPLASACLVEPAAVSLHGLRLARVTAGARVGVVGGGAIGLLAAAGARARGADVGLEARHPHQREAGEHLGASGAAGRYDVVVEASGSESGLARAVELAAPGAALVVLSLYGSGIPLPLGAFLGELRVLPSLGYCRHAGGRDFDDAARLLAGQPQIADTLVTHRFPLEDAAEAFRVAADRAAGAIRVVLEP